MQNDAGDFVDMYIPRKCSKNNVYQCFGKFKMALDSVEHALPATEIVAAKDHASVQINVAESVAANSSKPVSGVKALSVAANSSKPVSGVKALVDETTGRMTGTNKTYAICGKIRQMGESDDSLVRLTKRDGIIAKNY